MSLTLSTYMSWIMPVLPVVAVTILATGEEQDCLDSLLIVHNRTRGGDPRNHHGDSAGSGQHIPISAATLAGLAGGGLSYCGPWGAG